MIDLTQQQIAEGLGATQVTHGSAGGSPLRAQIDSREVAAGDLFFGISGESVDGGDFAAAAIERGAWGVVVEPRHFERASAAASESDGAAFVFAVDSAVSALGALATTWRRVLGADVIGITGSTGKTSTKDILAAMLGRSRTVIATPGNYNTEIGLPLTILSAPRGTEALVLEMAMRGANQIDLLARIAEPNVGCIVNIGPVHLEQMGTIENIAAAKSELIAALGSSASAVMPADEPLLAPHFRDDISTITFGVGGDVRLLGETPAGDLQILAPNGELEISPSFSEQYLTRNLLAAVACSTAIDAPVDRELVVQFSALRGEVSEVLAGVTLINDCYNANPVSMRAALDNLARSGGRRLAVLGGMAELGVDSDRFHHEVARHAASSGVDFLITVGDLAGAYGDGYVGTIEHVASPEAAAHVVRSVAKPGDTVLVKGSRSVGLERVGEILTSQTAAGGAQ